jgi:hypothetical protein
MNTIIYTDLDLRLPGWRTTTPSSTGPPSPALLSSLLQHRRHPVTKGDHLTILPAYNHSFAKKSWYHIMKISAISYQFLLLWLMKGKSNHPSVTDHPDPRRQRHATTCHPAPSSRPADDLDANQLLANARCHNSTLLYYALVWPIPLPSSCNKYIPIVLSFPSLYRHHTNQNYS